MFHLKCGDHPSSNASAFVNDTCFYRSSCTSPCQQEGLPFLRFIGSLTQEPSCAQLNEHLRSPTCDVTDHLLLTRDHPLWEKLIIFQLSLSCSHYKVKVFFLMLGTHGPMVEAVHLLMEKKMTSKECPWSLWGLFIASDTGGFR